MKTIKLITNKKLIIILSAILFLCIFTIGSQIFKIEVFAESNLQSESYNLASNEESADINSDIFFYKEKQYLVSEYYQQDDIEGDLFGSTYDMLERSDGFGYFYKVYGDDPIISLIPKERFYTEGSYFEIGKEWGYFIKTQAAFPASYYEDTTDKKTSFVTLFNINQEFDVYTGVVTVSVSPLFQFEYVALPKDERATLFITGNGFDIDSYQTPIEYTIENETEEYTVIPAALRERNRYYLKNISYSLSLYNEQNPNVINGETIYRPQDDCGAFFTYMDYAYDGVIRENKEFPVDAVVTISKSAVDFLVGKFKVFSTVDKIFKISNTLKTTLNNLSAADEIIDYRDNPIIYNEVEKHITSEKFNPNRDEQIRLYGGLLKTMGIIIEDEPNGKNVWFGMGNSASAEFQVNDLALNGRLHNYTRLIREVAFSIVDAMTDSVVDTRTSSASLNLFNPVYEEIEMEGENDLFLLPDGTNYFKFTPKYSGAYKFETENPEALNITIENAGGEKINGEGTYYSLTAGETYYIMVKTSEYGIVSKLHSSVSENTSGNLMPGEKRIVSCPIEDAAVYSFASGNKNVAISEIYGEIADYMGDSIVNDSEKVELALKEGNCFVILENIGNQTVSYQLVANRELPSVAVGGGQKYQLSKKHFSYIQITGAEKGSDYIVSTSVKGLTIIAYGDGLTKLPMTYYANGNYRISADGENIYFGAISDSDVITTITVNKSKNAYAWTINGKKLDTTAINLEIGKTYQLGFLINGIEQGNEFVVSPDQFGTNLHFSINGNLLTIENYCEFNTGNSLMVQYKYSDEAVYTSALYIQPVFNVEMLNFTAVNDESIGFSYVQKEYLNKIYYELSIGNETRQYENWQNIILMGIFIQKMFPDI